LIQKGKPFVIIARTIKGKGVSFMENNNLYHYKAPSEEEYRKALEELESE
jgi:transketolase